MNSKKKDPKTGYTHFGIVIPTYYRADGKSKEYLERALQSIVKQNYPKQFLHVVVVGDRYEPQSEFADILHTFKGQIDVSLSRNLSVAAERDKNYPANALWSYGGVAATIYGISTCIEACSYWVAHLDHDDYYESEDHFKMVHEAIELYNPSFVFSKAKYLKGYLPDTQHTEAKYLLRWPEPYKLIHSSVCFNVMHIPMRYNDIYADTGEVGMPADADLWKRITPYMLENGLKSIFINRVTVSHQEEGYERNK